MVLVGSLGAKAAKRQAFNVPGGSTLWQMHILPQRSWKLKSPYWSIHLADTKYNGLTDNGGRWPELWGGTASRG